MQGTRGSIIIVLVAFAMLLTQSVFSRVLAPYPFSPYLGLTARLRTWGRRPGCGSSAAPATAFAIGYLYDLFTGNPLGLHTFVFVVGYLTAWLSRVPADVPRHPVRDGAVLCR